MRFGRRHPTGDDGASSNETDVLAGDPSSEAVPPAGHDAHPPLKEHNGLAVDGPDHDRRAIRGRVYGEPTTFGSSPWWSERQWWRTSASGEANDVRAHFGRCGGLSLGAASLRGNRHRLGGVPCEDSFAVASAGGDDRRDFLVVAVCDGMGSVPHSAYGARITAQTTVLLLTRLIEANPRGFGTQLWEEQASLLDSITKIVRGYRHFEFGAPPVPRSEFEVSSAQTTLSFAVLPTDPMSDVDPVVATIGDSPVLVLADANWHPVTGLAEDSGLWSSATDGALGASSLAFATPDMTGADALLLCTDGVGNYLRFQGGTTELGADLASRWKRPVGHLDFLRDISFEIVSADDDRTAAMIWMASQSDA